MRRWTLSGVASRLAELRARPGRLSGVLVSVTVGLITAACPEKPNCATTPTSPGCADTSTVSTAQRVLGIAPIAQQTEVWCWAATAEMVFRHFGLPSVNSFGNYQCGIVAAYFGGACTQNCGLCVAPIGSMSELNRVLLAYGAVARQLGLRSPLLTSRQSFRALSPVEITSEIESGRPVVAGITAGGFPFPNIAQHVVVIVGYETDRAGTWLYVNDPFPYNLFALQGRQNPYFAVRAREVRPGQYRIAYGDMVGFMAWANTIDQIQAF